MYLPNLSTIYSHYERKTVITNMSSINFIAVWSESQRTFNNKSRIKKKWCCDFYADSYLYSQLYHFIILKFMYCFFVYIFICIWKVLVCFVMHMVIRRKFVWVGTYLLPWYQTQIFRLDNNFTQWAISPALKFLLYEKWKLSSA